MTETKFIYKAFGLYIASELPLPELPFVDPDSSLIDVTVEFANLTDVWEEVSEGKERYFVIEEQRILFRMPGVAIFQIEEGKRIFISPMNDFQLDHIRLYLLGTCMGAILIQRRILPLHGSAVAINGKAYAIVGDSGAGKSTLASAFLNSGYQLLSDDVIPVSFNEENVPVVTPAYPQQKLWIQSLEEFGMESFRYRPIVDRETKFAIPLTSEFARETLPLAGVYELTKTDTDEISIVPIQNLERFQKLFYHTYRNFFVEHAGLLEWHFTTCAKMVNQLEIYQIERPVSRFTANDLVEQILATINKEVTVG